MTAGLSARYVRNSADLHPFYQETHVHFPQVVLDSPSQFEVPWGGNFDIIFSVWKVKSQIEIPCGANFDITLSLWTAEFI